MIFHRRYLAVLETLLRSSSASSGARLRSSTASWARLYLGTQEDVCDKKTSGVGKRVRIDPLVLGYLKI
jgi:hypothetical protein